MKRQADVYITNDSRDQHLLEDGGDDAEPVRAAGGPACPPVQPALNRLLARAGGTGRERAGAPAPAHEGTAGESGVRGTAEGARPSEALALTD